MDRNDIIDVRAVDQTTLDGLRTWGWVSYILHMIVGATTVMPGSQLGIFFLLLGLVIDLVKRSSAEGTWHASHFSWRIRSVIWCGVLYIATLLLCLLLMALYAPSMGMLAVMVSIVPGWIAWALISLWFLYRIVRGMLAMSRGEPLPA